MNDDYSKREIDHAFEDIAGKLKLILDQTTKHNGRMTSLERWRSYTTGAMAVIIALILPILGWSLYQIANLDKNIDDHITKGLTRYFADYNVDIK